MRTARTMKTEARIWTNRTARARPRTTMTSRRAKTKAQTTTIMRTKMRRKTTVATPGAAKTLAVPQ